MSEAGSPTPLHAALLLRRKGTVKRSRWRSIRASVSSKLTRRRRGSILAPPFQFQIRDYALGVCELQRLRSDDLDAVFAFELANRTYFASFISDRGEEFYERYAEHHREQLAEQDTGACIFHVLVDQSGAIIGRFNLYDLADGSARVGYRVAQQAAGRGVATSALRELCRRAQTEYGLRMLTAETLSTSHASQRVLEKAGFSAAEPCEVAGQPGIRYALQLTSGA